MRHSLQLNLPPMPVQPLDTPSEAHVQKLDLPDNSLNEAKESFGRALKSAIGDSSLKEFGDPSQVKRTTDGDISNVIARVWQREDTRLEFVKALAKESGVARVHCTIEFDEPIRRRA